MYVSLHCKQRLHPTDYHEFVMQVNQNLNAAAGVGDSSAPRPPPANPPPAPAKALPTATALNPRPAPAAVPDAMPTATALKARLLRQPTANTPGAKDAAPPAKGKSSHNDTPQPSDDSDDDGDDDSDDDSNEDSAAEPSLSGGSEEDYLESDSSDDDTPLAAPKGGSKARKGKSAAAAQGVPTPDECEFDPDKEMYGEANLLTPRQYYEKYKGSINLEAWEKLRNFPTTYQNEDSDHKQWKKKRETLPDPTPAAVDLPPIPRQEAVAARQKRKSPLPLAQELQC